jgi:hypothetical protein
MYNQIFSQIVNVASKETKKEETISTLYFSVNELNNDTYKMIKEAKEGSIVTIAADIDGIIPAEVFDSIKESTKQLVIDLYGNEWVFNGVDIETSKPIDVSMDFYDANKLEDADAIKTIVGDKAVVLEFPENGNLPGKALIRIKNEEVFNKLTGNVYFIYHIDDVENKLNKVAIEVQKSSDGYLEFYINHNSKYVITTEEIKDTNVVGTDDSIAKVNAVVETAKKDNKKEKGNDVVLYAILGVCLLVIVLLVVVILKKPGNEPKGTDGVEKNTTKDEPKE